MESSMTVVAALATGLVTSVHCVAMCGPLACSVSQANRGETRTTLSYLGYHFGRLISYTSIGAICGALGEQPLRWIFGSPAVVLPWLLVALFLVTGISGCTSNEAPESNLPPAKDSSGFDPVAKAQADVKKASRTGLNDSQDTLLERYVGAVTPIREATIGPKASGTISSILVEEGDTVEKGDKLFRLAGGAQSIGIKQAQASLSGAVIARDQAKRALDRQQKLKDRGSISTANFDQAKSGESNVRRHVSQSKQDIQNIHIKGFGDCQRRRPRSVRSFDRQNLDG